MNHHYGRRLSNGRHFEVNPVLEGYPTLDTLSSGQCHRSSYTSYSTSARSSSSADNSRKKTLKFSLENRHITPKIPEKCSGPPRIPESIFLFDCHPESTIDCHTPLHTHIIEKI